MPPYSSFNKLNRKIKKIIMIEILPNSSVYFPQSIIAIPVIKEEAQ